jgi:hypothetical protein
MKYPIYFMLKQKITTLNHVYFMLKQKITTLNHEISVITLEKVWILEILKIQAIEVGLICLHHWFDYIICDCFFRIFIIYLYIISITILI